MIDRATMDELKRVLVAEAATDTVGLWAVLWQVRHALPALMPDEARRTTMAVIREALAETPILPGQFVDQDEDTAAFVPWSLDADNVIARIESEWDGLGREPNLGDIVWFVDPALLPLTADRHPMGKDWKPR